MYFAQEGRNPSSRPDLILNRVRKVFGGAVAVDIISLSLSSEGVTALIGPNGAGKTTVFDLISGFLSLSSGQVVYGGSDLGTRSPEWRARHGLVRTFQLTRVFERMTVIENMLVGALPGRHMTLTSAVLRWRRSHRERTEVVTHALGLLHEVGLEGYVNTNAGDLSGGQKKLLEFSRARMTNPKILLLDEPLAGVNPHIREQMLVHIRELAESGVKIILVEHDMPRVLKVSDRVVVLDRGAVIADGTPESIASDENVVRAYLGGVPA